jgi:hypothetical protein
MPFEPRLAGGAAKAHGAIGSITGIASGGADFELPRASFRYARGTLRGGASGRWKVPRWDVENSNMDISGSQIALSNVVTTGTAHDERDWWGRFNILSGRLQKGLSAETAVSASDARPLYTLFGAKLPGWAEGIFKLEGLKATARVRLASRLLDIENLEASGGKFHIAGRYRQKGEDRHGAFLVETGILSVGIAIEGPRAASALRRRKWFAEDPEATQTQPLVHSKKSGLNQLGAARGLPEGGEPRAGARRCSGPGEDRPASGSVTPVRPQAQVPEQAGRRQGATTTTTAVP